MQIITSKENEIIKHIKKLKDKKYRDLNNEYIVEGIKLVKEAIQENAEISKIILSEDFERNELVTKELMYDIAKEECIYVNQKIFKYISQVEAPQGILAIVKKGNKDGNNIKYDEDIIVALDDVQDPGNLGTILRTVDSIGITQILVSNKTADAYNPKVVRSTMGAIFRINIIECEDLKKTLKEVKKHNYKTVVTSLQATKNIYEIDYSKKVIVIGNEANGVEQEIQDDADEKVKIPMLGKTESLNASIAAGIVLYEYVRQKIK